VAPELIVMVSCGPESLGRDLVVLYQMGYEPESVQPVDMFPHTMQIESVAIVRRRANDLKPKRGSRNGRIQRQERNRSPERRR
jgi:hypothetical protein